MLGHVKGDILGCCIVVGVCGVEGGGGRAGVASSRWGNVGVGTQAGT